jgi:pyruvyltransferase
MRSRFYNKHFRKPLRLYWWRYEYPNKTNFGDEITPYIIEKLFGLKTVWSEPENCELAGTGSIIEILQESSGKNDIQVWGSGFIKPGDNNTLLNLHFTALRGKLSRDRTDNKLAALGDPGLLAPLVFKPRRATKHKLGIIPHYVDQNNAVLER